jgi:hypothetical protein
MKLNGKDLISLILEAMEDSTGDELLHEAWDSGWPSNFETLRSNIKGFTTKGKIAESILSKYAFEAMPFRFLKAKSPYKDEGIWNAYFFLFKAFVGTYVRADADTLKKMQALMKGGFSDEAKDAWYDKFMRAKTYKGKDAGLRVLNKMVSSLSKQIRKFWASLDEKDWARVEFGLNRWNATQVTEEFEMEVSRKIQALQFQEASLITSRILEIIEFVNMDKGDDNAKKLTAFYKKIKKAADSDTIDVLAIADDVDIINQTKNWADDEQLKLDMTPCEDDEADWDAPCVLHKFDDGFFWYDIKANSCEISARKLNNCGQASTAGGSLYNLMSSGKTGKPKWHVMVEYNSDTRTIVQVLGNSNAVPKEEYWPHIKWLWEDFQKPMIEKGAWEHVQGEDIKNKVYKFLKFIGLKSSDALTDSWNQMITQVDDGFYSVKSYESDYAPTGEDFARLQWVGGSNYVNMSVRIRKRLIEPKAGKSQFDYEHIRDFKAAARAMNNSDELYSILERIIPEEREELFDKNEITQRVRFSHGGVLMLYLNWTTKVLQNLDGGRHGDADYRNQLQRETLVTFMQETQRNFTVEAMYAVATYLGDKVEEAADEYAMKRDSYNRGDDLDEESQKILSELLKVSKPKKD